MPEQENIATLENNILNNRKEYTNLELLSVVKFPNFDQNENSQPIDEIITFEVWRTQKYELTTLEIDMLNYGLPTLIGGSKYQTTKKYKNIETILSSSKLLNKKSKKSKTYKFHKHNEIDINLARSEKFTFKELKGEDFDIIFPSLGFDGNKIFSGSLKRIESDVITLYGVIYSGFVEDGNTILDFYLNLQSFILNFIQYWQKYGKQLAKDYNYPFDYLNLENILILSLKKYYNFRSEEVRETLNNFNYRSILIRRYFDFGLAKIHF